MKIIMNDHGMITIRDMTPAEIAEIEAAQAAYEEAERNRPPTEAERLEALEAAMLELAEVMANG